MEDIMTSGNGRLLIGPSSSGTESLPAILGGGNSARISVSVSNSTSGGFKGPFEGALRFVNECGDWEDREFYSSGNSASVTVNTHDNSMFEPLLTIYNPNLMGLRLHFRWTITGLLIKDKEQNMNIKEVNVASVKNSAVEEIIEQISDTSNDILLKRSDDLTEDELKELMKKRSQLTNDKSTFNELVEKERQWFSARYGDEPVNYDETGKMIQPVPINPAPKERKPLMVPENKTMVEAIKQVADQLGNVSGDKTEAVRGLQIGINRTKGEVEVPLKTDGQFGPKSAQALKKAIAALGPTKIGEANVLGQFQNKVMVAKKSGDPKTALDNITNMVAPLLPDKNKDNESYVGLALQS
jgi:hypothetical protein